MSATPRSGEGHDVGPDGCDPRHGVDHEPAVDVAAQRSAGDPGAARVNDAATGNGGRVLHRRQALSRRSRRISVALAVAFLYVVADVIVKGPLVSLDKVFWRWHHKDPVGWRSDVAWIYDKMGQRSVLLPIMLVLAGWLARKHRTWRPLVLSFTAFLILNVVVGVLKIVIGRSETETHNLTAFTGGIIFPSGHSSNMVLTGGMMAYLMIRYLDHPPVKRFLAVWSVLTCLTIATSLYLVTHWVSDLIAGVFIGGLLLQAVIVFDRKTAHVRDDPPALVAAAIRLIEPSNPGEPGPGPGPGDSAPVRRSASTR
ncbi:MAG: phosphatase PAP2 family protein [Friedmanniella sp.]